MRYRKFGKLDRQVSALSLGCMRFPSEEAAFEIVAKAVELGINYFETSIRYVNRNSERWLGKGLGQDRKKVMVSTKSTPLVDGEGVSADGVRRTIDESLEKLGTDYVDFYHGWSVSRPPQYEACVRKGGWFESVYKAKEEGLVKHIGITTHAPPEMVMEMIDDGRWEVITVQYSLILRGYRDVVKAAYEKGIGIVVILCLVFSLVESQLILPSHLGHSRRAREHGAGGAVQQRWKRVQNALAGSLVRLAEKGYRPLLDRALVWRYATLSGGVVLLVWCLTIVAAGHLHDVQVEHVCAVRHRPRRDHHRLGRQQIGVRARALAPGLVPSGQVLELDVEDGCLDRVEPAVEPDRGVLVLDDRAPVAQQAQLLGQLVVARHHDPAVAVRA